MSPSLNLPVRWTFVPLACAIALLPWRSAIGQSQYESFGKTMAYQGYTGLMNIPTADITPQGYLEAGFNNHVDGRFVNKYASSRNYAFSLGLLPFMEFGGRFAEMPSKTSRPFYGDLGLRDISGNVKIQIPTFFQPDTQIAVGIEDVGGGAAFFRSKYGVVTQTIGPFKLTAGYGTGPDRLKGGFAGADVHLLNGVYLMADHEPSATAVGARYFSPNLDLLNSGRVVMSIQRPITQTSNLKRGTELALTLQIPLFGRYRTEAPASQSLFGSERRPETGVPSVAAEPGQTIAQSFSVDAEPLDRPSDRVQPVTETVPVAQRNLATIRDALLRQGFSGVRIGTAGTTLVVVYENHRYNVNEIDALGLVLGHAALNAPDGIERVAVYTSREGLPVQVTRVNLDSYRDYLQGGNKQIARHDLEARPAAGEIVEAVDWDGGVAGDAARLRVGLNPKLRTVIGTENAAFSYSLAAGIQAIAPVWKGATISLHTVAPLAESTQFADGGTFSSSRIKGGVEQFTLNQGWWLPYNVLTLTSVGRLRNDYYGATNESVWTSSTGVHQVEARLGGLKAVNKTDLKDRAYAVGTYQYYFFPLDSVVRATYGRYLVGDTGLTLEFKRRFGDVEVALNYRQTSFKSAGIQISVPLTARQEGKASTFGFEGPSRFTNGVQSTLQQGGGNPIYLNQAVIPISDYNIDRVYMNYGRLNEAYLVKNFDRLRDAYWRFRGQ